MCVYMRRKGLSSYSHQDLGCTISDRRWRFKALNAFFVPKLIPRKLKKKKKKLVGQKVKLESFLTVWDSLHKDLFL